MEIKKIGVVGCGIMGSGIAQVCAQSGYQVVVSEMNDELLKKGLRSIDSILTRNVNKGKLSPQDKESIVARIKGTTKMEDFSGCDLTIEAAPEVLEIKKALIALATRGSDPTQSSDPIKEDAWKNIITLGDFTDAWDGPTADEFMLAMSRFKGYIDGPHFQSFAPPPDGIVGGPQPLAKGLEALAGAVENVLNGTPVMTQYLAWRNGTLDPPSLLSGPSASDPVLFCRFREQPWNLLGYTPIWDGAPDYMKAQATSVDEQLITAWGRMYAAEDEFMRSAVYSEVKLLRSMHDGIARAANVGAVPQCAEGWEFNRVTGSCEKKPVVITLPPTIIEIEDESFVSKAAVPVAAIMVLGAVGAFMWWSKNGTPEWMSRLGR